MLNVNERAQSPLFTNDWNSLTYTFNYQIDIYEAFVNPEESFREGLFYAQITQNLFLYLRMFHEWGPMCLNVLPTFQGD